MPRGIKFTGKRQDIFQFIKSSGLSGEERTAAINKLVKQQKSVDKAAAKRRAEREEQERQERARQLALEMKQFEERQAKRKQKAREYAAKRREERKILGKTNVLFSETYDGSGDKFLDRFWLSIKGRTVRIITSFMDTVQSNISYKDLYLLLIDNYNGDHTLSVGDKLVIVEPTPVSPKALRQRFLDGKGFHCAIDPLIKRLAETLMSSTSKSLIKRYKQRISALECFKQKYSKGVYPEEFEEIAKSAGFKVVITDALGNHDSYVFNEHGRVGTVRFRNTRANHIDVDNFTNDDSAIIISEQQLVEKWKQCRETKTFCHWIGNIHKRTPIRITTLEGKYQLENPNAQCFNELNNDIDLRNIQLNAKKHPDVNEFIVAGRIINAWTTVISDCVPDQLIDMPNAYANFTECHMFAGFLGMIHEWRTGQFDAEWLRNHIGIYQFRVISNSNELFNRLGLQSTHILPSVEILYFIENGVEVEITAGVWGSRMDFDFPDVMVENKTYREWSGRLSMEYHTTKEMFTADKQWADHLTSVYGKNNVHYFADDNLCCVSVPSKNVYTAHHVLAFLTSYVRIQMMEMMKLFDINNISRVVLDGIYFKGERPVGTEWFKVKTIEENEFVPKPWYEPVDMTVNWNPVKFSGHTLLAGQGGCGKTYSVMTDSCYNDMLYVSPQNLLGKDVYNKYKVPYTTINKLIGEQCSPYKTDHKTPPVIVIDEITQIDAPWINRVFKMYDKSLILLIGDINQQGQWFQCRNGKPGEFSKIWKPSIPVVMYTGDRRSQDDELKSLKLAIRSKMEQVFTTGDDDEVHLMRQYARTFKCVSFHDAASMFQPGDTWIAGTHKTNKELLIRGVVSGWYKKGGYVSNVEQEDYEKRGSFTIHSFQGRTIESGRIFISISDLFEYAMFYTAVSRATRIEQLVFVD